MTMDALTQIESRLEAAWNDLETVRNAFIEHNRDCLALHKANHT